MSDNPLRIVIISDDELLSDFVVALEEAAKSALETRASRSQREAGTERRCVAPPIGCGKTISPDEFEHYDTDTRREYVLSAWCSACQDKVFGVDE